MKRVRLTIFGDVQGVGFRAWAHQLARSLELTGWVKNCDDGGVELVAEGPAGKLEELVKRCHQGPEVAWVERVDVQWEKVTGEFMGFEVVY